MMLGIVGLRGENGEGVKVSLALHVLDQESVANLLKKGVLHLRLVLRLGVLELVNYLFAQLKFDVVDKFVVLAEGVHQLLLVKVLLIHGCFNVEVIISH
jgi:hypothetical protein